MPRGGVASLLDVFPRAWLERLRTRTQNGRESTHRPGHDVLLLVASEAQPGATSPQPQPRTATPRPRPNRAHRAAGARREEAGRARGLGTAL